MKNKEWIVVICWALATAIVFWFLFFGPGDAIGFAKGFKLYASTTSNNYGDDPVAVTFGWNHKQMQWTPTSTDTWYFVVTAFNASGESEYSGEISQSCTEGETITFGWDYSKCTQNWSVYNNCARYISIDTDAIPITLDSEGGGSVSFSPQKMYGDNQMTLGDTDIIELGENDSIEFTRY